MMKQLAICLLVVMLGAAMSVGDEADVLINETFDETEGRLPAGWRADGPGWRVARGALVVDSLREPAAILVGEPDWQDYEISATATFQKVARDAAWVSVVFRAEPGGTLPWSHVALRFRASRPKGAEFAVRLGRTSWWVRRAAKLAGDCRLGQPRRFRVVVRGSDVEAFVDDKPVLDSSLCLERETGCVGLAASGCVARFTDFRVRRLPAAPRLSQLPLKPCEVVAHRGFSAVAPENTLASARQAIRAGADGSECDVYRSKDGAIVLMHDPTVNRTTNGKGKITELTLARLKSLDAGAWKGKKFAGERIPTLDELLAVHKGTGCAPVVEIKMKGIEQPVIEAIHRAGLMDKAAVIAFDGEVVLEVRSREPRLPCAWLFGGALQGTPAERADWLEKKAKQEYRTNMLDLGYSVLSRELVAELHRRGMVVWAWTVDDPVIIDALMRWGVDSITTNRPDVVLRHVEKARSAHEQM